MRLTFRLPLLLPLLLLAGCGGDSTSDDGRSASGEVLEGTISDAMLPLATATSQPPLLPPEQQDGRRGEQPAAAGGAPTAEAPVDEGTGAASAIPTGEPTQSVAPEAP